MSASKTSAHLVRVDPDPMDNPMSIDAQESTPFLQPPPAAEVPSKPQNTWDGAEDFEHLPRWRRPSVYWLLGPFFLFTLAFGGIIVPKLNLINDLICRQHFADQTIADPAFTFTPVVLGADNPQCLIPEVKKRSSLFMMIMNLTIGILSVVAAPRFGQLSDRYGRTKLLALASCGGVLAEAVTILCAKFPDTFPYQWLILAAICDGAAGSFTTGTILSNSYTSDCTPASRRAVSFGYIQACLFTGIAIGPLLAAYFVVFTGSLLSIFYVTLGCHTFFVLFVGFVVPESLSERRQKKAQEKHEAEMEAAAAARSEWVATAQFVNAFAPLKALWLKQPGDRAATFALRRNLVALAGVDMILLGTAVSAGPVIILYCESDNTWNWGNLESSRFISGVSFVRVIVLLALLPLINHFFRVRPAARRVQETGVATVEANRGADTLDVWLIRLSLLSDVAGALGYLVSRREELFVVSGMLTAMGGLGNATIQSAATKHVPAERVGRLLGALGLLQALSRVVGPIAFMGLYSATVGTFDQAIFVLLLSLYGLAFLSSLTLRPHVYYHEPEDDSNEREPLLHHSQAGSSSARG